MSIDIEPKNQPFDNDPMSDVAKYLDTPGANNIGAAVLTLPPSVKKTDGGFKPPFTDETLANELAEHAQQLEGESIKVERDKLLEALNFRLVHDTTYEPNLELNSFSSRVDNKIAFYRDRHKARRKETGKHEAAEWGYGSVNGNQVIVFSLDFAFMGGSLNPVVAKLHREAADEAIRKKIPLISDYRTGGARQEENAAALYMMPEISDDIERVKEAGLLTVGIAQNETWGGIPASAMPRNDFLIAYEGGKLGFAGARVGDKSRDSRQQTGIPPEVAQRAETHAIKRNVEILVQDHTELVDVLEGLLVYRKPPRVRKKLKNPNGVFEPGRELPVSGRHIQSAHLGRRALSATSTIWQTPREFDPDDPMELYRRISFDPTLIDTDTFITSLESPVPLYNRFRDKDGNIIYPKIITGLGKIAGQTYFVIGHQPSFVKKKLAGAEEFVRFSSVPGPKDMKLGLRHIDFAKRKGYPIITFAETFGAEASVDAELHEQFRYISDYQRAYRTHPKPVYAFGLMIGSGGGLILAPRDDNLALFDGSHTMVAEAYSSAAITFKIKDREPTLEEVIHTLGALNPYAEQQKALGIADDVLPIYPSPLQTAYAMQRYVFEKQRELGSISADDLRDRRVKRSNDFINGLIVSKT